MHSIRTDFGFNLLRSASKLKRGVELKKFDGCFWFSVFVNFPSPNIFVGFCFAVNRDGDIVRELFSVKFILHFLWYTPLVYVFMNLFFNVIFCVCSLFFIVFSQPDVNITWITGHIHRSIIDKIDPNVEMDKKNTLSITLVYITDDTIVYLTITSDIDSVSLQDDLNKLAKWEERWKMTLHPEKCNVLTISRKCLLMIPSYFLL